MTASRRQFLTYLGAGSLAAITGQPSLGGPAPFPAQRRKGAAPSFFEPIAPSAEDRLIVPEGFKVDRVVTWGDMLGSKAPDGSAETFGFNNDFIAYFPLDGLTGGTNSSEGLLWVNHEYPSPLFVSGYSPANHKAGIKKTVEQVKKERACVGGSVVHVRRTNGSWSKVIGSNYNRRFTADYPEMAMTGPAGAILKSAIGTLANCSGGRTPWLTALSCEENYPDFNDEGEEGYRWNDAGLGIDETRYGWVVEVDPYGKLPPLKHTALGRFKHENTALRIGATGKLVIYMGDDEANQHFYKFVSAETLNSSASREQQRKVLETGTLYVADLAKGQWIPLIYSAENRARIEKSSAFADEKKKIPDLKIESQADLLINTRVAARALGATPLDRCEDCEVHPRDGSVFVALTNNTKHGNLYGHIMRLVEDGDDAEAKSFRYEIFLAGGPQSGLACPDNLAFDKFGNLWVVCDISSGKLGKGAYKPFGNNGLFVVPTEGPSAGDAFQFGSGPVECELTGPWFTEDHSTLFLSVQHPGELSESVETPTSHWPHGGKEIPRPSVVAVTGFNW
jgi:uncharacterized protein